MSAFAAAHHDKRQGEPCFSGLHDVITQVSPSLTLGELIANLNQPGIAAAMLSSLDSSIADQIEKQAAAASMTSAEFVFGAVREFADRANDDLWFQLLTVIRRAEDPSLEAIRTILRGAVESAKR